MKVTCPYCARQISVDNTRYARHAITPGGSDYCPMVGQRMPITGQTESDWESRAYLVTNLAGQVQDQDPHIVWHYLTALPPVELQRLLMVSLCAIPAMTDQSVDDLFAWVKDLPDARSAAAAGVRRAS